MELISERVSKSLKALRTELRLSQKEAGERIGVPQQTWGNWESGRSVPEQSNWTRICEAFSKDLAWFFLTHDEPTEIVRGAEAEAFRAFQRMFQHAAQSVTAIGQNLPRNRTDGFSSVTRRRLAMAFSGA